jgi:DNA-binding NarL/FixJ family response regulator
VTRVIIVDDDPHVRAALALMLGGQSEIEVVGQAGDGEAGVALSREVAPDVVLMDIRTPGLNGLEATRSLNGGAPSPKVIVLTTFDADDHVIDALAAGADGFLKKDTAPEQIAAAIHTVAEGEAMLSPAVTRSVISRVRHAGFSARTRAAVDRLALLTEREKEVAVSVGKGMTNADIAGELFLSVPTVKAHVSRVFDKLEVTNRVQIAMVVHDAGLV